MLSAAELGELVESAQHSIYRLETLPEYDVEAQRGYLDAYLGGEALDLGRRQRWLDTLRKRAERGIDQRHLRVLREPLSDYDRMACEWGYALNVKAGLDVRVLPEDDDEPPAWGHDFYLIDERTFVRVHYDPAGRFLSSGADESFPVQKVVKVFNNLWGQGESFAEWWAAHPEYHRQVVVG